MVRPRYSALIRISTLLLLLWVGFDIGAHGLLASDFGSLGRDGSSPRIGANADGATPETAPDHCFCHGISVGAVLPRLSVSLTPTGVVVLPLSSRVPRSDHNPLDHPPQLTA